MEKNQNILIWVEHGKNLFAFEENIYICNTYRITTNNLLLVDFDYSGLIF